MVAEFNCIHSRNCVKIQHLTRYFSTQTLPLSFLSDRSSLSGAQNAHIAFVMHAVIHGLLSSGADLTIRSAAVSFCLRRPSPRLGSTQQVNLGVMQPSRSFGVRVAPWWASGAGPSFTPGRAGGGGGGAALMTGAMLLWPIHWLCCVESVSVVCGLCL